MSLIIIVGATATGKSELALAVAQRLNAEIVNADSMQVYRGMDIGTAKLPLEERQGITHHLLDLLEITQEANVSWYQGLARAKIDEILQTGKSVVVVGGTGLYIKAILDDMNFPKQFGLVLDRENLDAKIDRRVEDMWEKGFVREVMQLLTKGLEQATTAKMALGYSQIMSYLNGDSDEAFAKEETKRVTRAYARRQETWFSRDDRIKWLAPESSSGRLEKLLASIN